MSETGSTAEPHVATVTDLMAETMVNWGVEHVFGMVGSLRAPVLALTGQVNMTWSGGRDFEMRLDALLRDEKILVPARSPGRSKRG